MWTYLALGLSMGASSGISPGPLLALVISATLRSGFGGGLRVALAPFITDAPIILLTVFVVGALPAAASRWLGTASGLVVIVLGVEALKSAPVAHLPGAWNEAHGQTGPLVHRELWRGVLVNAFNPHPYLFWATVGAPALIRGWRTSPWHAVAFLVPFYTLLVGSKITLAWLVGHRAGRLPLVWYRRLLAGCGLLLLVMGALLIGQAWLSG